jgi:U5 small nuclear ribonucleoprotein component
MRYTDTHVLSREREISLKSSPMSFILSTSAGKSHLLHLIDTPGHVNFLDEVASAMRLVDGIVLVVDVVEGVGDNFASNTRPNPGLQIMVNTERIIRHALQEGVKITLVVNKIDRLILELRIKPADAYYKIKHTIEEINTFIRFVVQAFLSSSGLTFHLPAALTQVQNYDLARRMEMCPLRVPTCTGVLL